MPLRTFVARDGTIWSVWRIQSTSASDALGVPHAWLMFQDDAGRERRRLVQFPADWETLADDRLELLCRAAKPARVSPPGGISRLDDD